MNPCTYHEAEKYLIEESLNRTQSDGIALAISKGGR